VNGELTKKGIKVDVALANSFDAEIYKSTIQNSICAVIDTITATSSITTMFSSKCSRIILSKEKDEAFQLKEILSGYLLCGEENGFVPEGFDYGNFPSEFSKIDLKDKKIIFKSTNGTVSFFKLVEAEHVFAISLLNLGYSLKIISDLAVSEDKNIFFVCSGTKGKVTYEDVYTAGMAIKYLMKIIDLDLSDSARIALDVVKSNSNIGIREAFEKFENIERLKEMGYYEDLIFSARLDVYDLVSNLKILDLRKNQRQLYSENHRDIYDSFESSKENHSFEKLLLLERF
jgi:2-phosphosulfolactate phosphatase